MFIPFAPAGRYGVNRDLGQHDLPPEVWTDCQNIRFLDGACWQAYGQTEVYPSPPVTPYHILPCTVGSQRYWLYAGLTKIYAATNLAGVPTHTNLTRQTAGNDVNYTGAQNKWTSTLVGGIPVFSAGNLSDPPQSWDLNIAHRMTALANWPANTYCKAIRTFKNFLIALGVTRSGVSYPYLVKWSHPADPGTVPASWDETDATKDAGQFDLAEGEDQIVDGLQLGDSFIVYKEHSVWRMNFSGGVYVFNALKALGQSGALNVNCVVEVDGFHVVLTNNDVIVHDGQTPTSVLDKVTRRWLFSTMDPNFLSTAFVCKNVYYNEVWICYAPVGGDGTVSQAMTWNYKDRTVGFRTLPSINHAASGIVDVIQGTWATDTGSWDSKLSLWGSSDGGPSSASRLLMATNGQKLELADAAATADGALVQAYLERRGLTLDQPDEEPGQIKLVRGVRAQIVGNTGQTVLVKIGTQNDISDEPEWGPALQHIIGQTIQDDYTVAGRYIAIRFETGTAQQWRLDSFSIDAEPQGRW